MCLGWSQSNACWSRRSWLKWNYVDKRFRILVASDITRINEIVFWRQFGFVSNFSWSGSTDLVWSRTSIVIVSILLQSVCSGRPRLGEFPKLMLKSSFSITLVRVYPVVVVVCYSLIFFSGASRPGLIVCAWLYTVEVMLNILQHNASNEEPMVFWWLQHVESIP